MDQDKAVPTPDEFETRLIAERIEAIDEKLFQFLAAMRMNWNPRSRSARIPLPSWWTLNHGSVGYVDTQLLIGRLEAKGWRINTQVDAEFVTCSRATRSPDDVVELSVQLLRDSQEAADLRAAIEEQLVKDWQIIAEQAMVQKDSNVSVNLWNVVMQEFRKSGWSIYRTNEHNAFIFERDKYSDDGR